MRIRIVIAAAAALGAVATGAPAASPEPALGSVVIVSRHGVRAPTKPNAKLDAFSAEPWPSWPVAPGELTPHGAAGLRLMGAWLRAHYAARGLVPATGCPSTKDVFVWADGEDHRTVESGDALLAGFAPGCNLRAAHGPQGKVDPVFAASETAVCPLSDSEQKGVAERFRQRLAHLPPDYAPALAALRRVLAPRATDTDCAAKPGLCFASQPNTVRQEDEGAELAGPLSTGASLAENLSLEFLDGFEGKKLGWGRLDGATLPALMPVHSIARGITRRDPVVAAHNAAVLAPAILSALDGRAALPAQGGVPARLTIFIGHDSNLDNLASVFGLDWTLPEQPDVTPPDGELVFERAAGGELSVAVRYQTAVQLRALTPLVAEEPGEVRLRARACDGRRCQIAAPACKT